MKTNLYETDFYAWTVQQADLLRERCLEQLDFVNLIEEIESLGKQQRQELCNRLVILIGHLLKWDYQPEKRSKSCFVSIRNQRRQIKILLKLNLSLKPFIQEALEISFPLAVDLVVSETPLQNRDLPSYSPYTWEQLLDPSFPSSLAEADF
ncbi:DUF29 domain-containing protein [Synechococcus sp. PCC 6312]|uniref:DUF29 domain-containing protein n=1 Tax=Synechococcus sp. (strain ATCC 27167 / PCC 6312) TaxID=195253 RepID=UPI00029F057B|nr:DUF29 domain-containing protein [Synechococcus sp. PCC 6312]AFY61467.1 protein of unknown function DUF29 [Synechococcus sp. PCC 6312]